MVTTGGIVGTVVNISGDMLVIRVKPDNIKLQIARSAVSGMIGADKTSVGRKEVTPWTTILNSGFLAIVAVTLACVYFIIGIPKSKADIIQNWNNNIRLGLDLRGGSELILRVNIQDAFKAERRQPSLKS